MKIKCLVNKIKSKISLAYNITSKNLSLPILNNILLEAKNNNLYIYATNLEVGVEFVIPSKIYKDGKCSVSGSILNNFLNKLDNNETVSIEKIGNNISISSKKNTTLLKTQPTDDFPIIPKIDNNKHTIKIDKITNGIKSVLFASAVSDIKPEIASVYIYTENENIVFVATDSFRLAEKKVYDKNIKIKNILIPYKNAFELVRFFENIFGNVIVSFNKNQLSITSDNMYFMTRLTDGVYPDYRQIIPKSYKTQSTILKDDLLEALRIADVFVDEFHRIVLHVITEDNVIEINSKNNNIGENVTIIDTNTNGEDIEVFFNNKYIIDILKILQTESVSLKFSDVNKPLVITGVGDESLTYIVMPVNR